MKSYLTFQEIPTNKKTKTFEVISKTDGSKLGEIKWHTGYRKYAFLVKSLVSVQAVDMSDDNEKISYFSEATYNDIKMGFKRANNGAITIQADTKIFDTVCLKEITSFIEKLMEERKANEAKNTIQESD